MLALKKFASLPHVDFLLKAVCYSIAVLFALIPLTSVAGCIAAVIAVPAALVAASLANRYRVRAWIVAVASLLLFAASFLVSHMLGSPIWISRLFGASPMLAAIQVATFGLLALAIVFVLRTFASRYPAMAIGECFLIVIAVVLYFFGHHGTRIDQPRFLSDWAFSAGHDPRLVLRIIGVVTIGLVGLMLLRTKRISQSVGAGTALLGLLIGGFFLSLTFVPDFENPVKHVDVTQTNAGQSDDDGPSFDPKRWPNHPTPMAIATLHKDYSPASGVYYFRQSAFSQFNGKRIVRAVESFDRDVPLEFVTQKQEYSSTPLVKNMQLTVPVTISLMQAHSRPIGLANVNTMEPRPNANPQSFERTYQVEAQVLNWMLLSAEILTRPCGDPSWTPEEREHYARVPADPRYKKLAEEILAANTFPKMKKEFRNSDVLKVLTIRQWIERNMTYWLEADHRHADDPVASFLFGSRKGFCVHVAHAMTYLSRSIGVPARVATGYSVNSSQSAKGSGILMTAADLHAWCEVYVEGLGWVIVDAALENSLSPPPIPVDPSVLTFFNEMNRPQYEPEDPRVPPQPMHSMLPILPALMIGLISLYGVKAYRRFAPHWVKSDYLYRITYRAIADLLAEVGLTRQFGETREEFAERVSRFVPDFVELTLAHVRQAATGESVLNRQAWLSEARKIKSHIKANFTCRRRWLGLAHPLSWMSVK